MHKVGIRIKINKILWEKALKKVESDFCRKYSKTDSLLIVMLLGLYKSNDKVRSSDNLYLVIENPEQISPNAYVYMTIAVYDGLLDMLQMRHPFFTYSKLIETVIVDYLLLTRDFYTDAISPLYTIIGSKNHTMQKATATAVDNMKINHQSFTLVDGCCATGSLFFGLKTYRWKSVILNDLNPLRTNFLNVLKKEPLKLIKKILETDFRFIKKTDIKNSSIKEFKLSVNEYATLRANYTKVDCNVDIAYKMFVLQCINKAQIEDGDAIINRTLRFLPAHLKLQIAIITQQDCLKLIENDNVNKLLLLDVPYIGSEHTCSVNGYKYAPFHQKVAECLHRARYPFLYFCRSTPPKNDKNYDVANGSYIMKMKLAQYFFNKGYFFEKVHLEKDTELLISNNLYNPKSQFQWVDISTDLT